MQLLGQQLEKEERNRGAQCIMRNLSAIYNSATLGRPVPALIISFIRQEGFKPNYIDMTWGSRFIWANSHHSHH